MAQGIIFAYSYNKFHATLTMRAQNTISTPTCVPETRFCCLKICGWDSGQPFVKSPGSSNTRPPCTYMKGKFPTPVNCLSGKFRGGGWLLQELTHALLPKCVIAHVSWRGLHLLPKWGPTRAHKKSLTQFWLSETSGIIYHL
jgi:hypothetical protein